MKRWNEWRLVGAASFLVLGCGSGNAASAIATPPKYQPNGQTTCNLAKSQGKPLILGWPGPDRGELETKLKKGVVVVQFTGCEMKPLYGCFADAKYDYVPFNSLKHGREQINNNDELYAKIPVFAAQFEAALAKSGELDVDMTLVGRLEAKGAPVRLDQLKGDCAEATHVVAAVTVGAFTFTSGGQADLDGNATAFGAELKGKSHSKRTMLDSDGEAEECKKATAHDPEPPERCNAPLRLEVAPLAPPPTPEVLALIEYHDRLLANIQELEAQLETVATQSRDLIRSMSAEQRAACGVPATEQNSARSAQRKSTAETAEANEPPTGKVEYWKERLAWAGVNLDTLNQQLEQSGSYLKRLKRCKDAGN